jgi:hypothetical protein
LFFSERALVEHIDGAESSINDTVRLLHHEPLSFVFSLEEARVGTIDDILSEKFIGSIPLRTPVGTTSANGTVSRFDRGETGLEGDDGHHREEEVPPLS